jgi:phage-related protein
MPVVGLLGDLFEGIVKPLMASIGPLIKDLSTGLMAVLKPVMQIIGPMFQAFVKGIAPVFEPIREVFASMSDLMTEIFGKGEGLGEVFKVIGSVLGSLLTAVFIPTKAVIGFMVQGIQSAIDVVGGFVDIFQGNFGEGMKKIAQGVIGFILRPFQFLIDIATGSLNAIIDGLNSIPGVDLPNVEFNLADTVTGMLPMAKGGIVTGPTKALVGEAGPEAVIPLREFYAKMDELIQAVKQGQNIYIGPNKLNESIGLNLHSVG